MTALRSGLYRTLAPLAVAANGDTASIVLPTLTPYAAALVRLVYTTA